MPKNIQEERLRWIKPILKKELKIVNLIKVCPYSERSIKRWLAEFRKNGESGLIPKSTRPKTHLKETSIRVKERIIEIRRESKECALKIKWDLGDESIYVHERTVGKILKKEGLVKKYRTKKIKYDYIRNELKPGEIIEIDVKYVPGRVKNRRYYQFTAIDLASRWRHLKIYEQQSNGNSVEFLRTIIRKAPFKIKAIKTDNHAIFTNRYTGYLKSSDPINPRLYYLDEFCAKIKINHYLIDKGKPTQNGTVERSHGSDQRRLYSQESFKNVEELKYKVRLWNMYYNDLRHCSLNGISPNQFLKNSNYLINTKVTNVRV
jgi:transposase